MSRTLFFDLASRTGWAAATERGKPIFGTIPIAKTGDNVGLYLLDADEKLGAIIDEIKPDLIGFESPILRQETTITTLRKIYSLAGKCEEIAARRKIECVEANLSDIRRHFLGSGYKHRSVEAKRAVCARCRTLGWDVKSDDEGDALAGLDYLRSINRPSHALKVTPLFGGRSAE